MDMDNKKLMIIILIIIIIALSSAIAYTLLTNQTKYINYTIPESGTILEIPEGMQQQSLHGVTVLKNDNTIIIIFNSQNKGIGEIMGFASIKNPIFGNTPEGNTTINNPTTSGFNLNGECNAVFKGNNTTHDNIIVISKDKNIVNHIFDSIIYAFSSVDNNTNEEDTSTQYNTDTPEKKAYAYKSDGTPMYSQSEVDKYMSNKYGDVDYHIADNGYVDMDEEGYDDAGNLI